MKTDILTIIIIITFTFIVGKMWLWILEKK